MSDPADILQSIRSLPARDRAAALAHWVYVRTMHRGDVDWQLRVESAWEDLDERAREFNRAAIDTWAQSPGVLEAWLEAVTSSRNEQTQGDVNRRS